MYVPGEHGLHFRVDLGVQLRKKEKHIGIGAFPRATQNKKKHGNGKCMYVCMYVCIVWLRGGCGGHLLVEDAVGEERVVVDAENLHRGDLILPVTL